ncbi:MAG: ribonuclease HII [Actinobacteria bacterium]|nr:ribonuclease HII [Actinomycetota bacterium]
MARSSVSPDLVLERELFTQHKLVVGIDEVGRGAYAGPVSVGVCVIDNSCVAIPNGLKDSKLLSLISREKLIPNIASWALATAVGDCEPNEIDEIGMTAALRLAANRALNSLDLKPDIVILDGSHNWLTPPTNDLFSEPPAEPQFTGLVVTKVKADLSCASVAAASVVAKVHRDSLMRHYEAQFPGYGFADHVGYGTSAHRDAIAQKGLTSIHRKSWNISST